MADLKSEVKCEEMTSKKVDVHYILCIVCRFLINDIEEVSTCANCSKTICMDCVSEEQLELFCSFKCAKGEH